MRFPSLDILRGIAATGVFGMHAISHLEWKDSFTTFPGWLLRWGWMGVDLFLVLSGFVIGLSAMNGLAKYETHEFRWRFVFKRLARILPLYLLTLILFVAITGEGKSGESVLTHLLFIHNFFYFLHGSINGPNWTIALEMQFYLLVLFAAPWFRKVNWWKWLPSMFLVSWAWRAFVFFYLADGVDPETRRKLLYQKTTLLPGALEYFALGIFTARWVFEGGLKDLRRRHHIALGLVTLTLVAATSLTIWEGQGYYWNSFGYVVFFRTLLAITCAACVLYFCTLNHPVWLWITSPLRYLGTISYGIYLFHLLVIHAVKGTALAASPWAFPVMLAALAGISSLSWHWFEAPILRWASSRLDAGGFRVRRMRMINP